MWEKRNKTKGAETRENMPLNIIGVKLKKKAHTHTEETTGEKEKDV